ncbi:uncharacterized protein LOC122010817 [Zingiber officinale]|uniref:uncharacterized protein LOC122010817 n=1 Tax=Zingiber officinale TaxID=94328 RepID=UPI001C4D167F|nr:uncharacterized protein LOC122010817 [Zingiber officinale]
MNPASTVGPILSPKSGHCRDFSMSVLDRGRRGSSFESSRHRSNSSSQFLAQFLHGAAGQARNEARSMEGGCTAASGALTFLVGDARIGCQGLGNWTVRGFEFVAFTSSEEASVAINGMDGKDVHGWMINVNYATDRMSEFRGGGGGSYGGGYGGYDDVALTQQFQKFLAS